MSAGALMGSEIDSPGDHYVTGFAAAGRAAHSLRPGERRTVRLLGAAAGLAAAITAVGLGTAALVRAPATTPGALPTGLHITVSAQPAVVPLAGPQIVGLLARQPDYGALSDPQRRASCLSGLGYPSSVTVLGAQPIDINGHAGVLLVLPGDTPRELVALAVAPNCSSADTGLIADTMVDRP